MKLILVFTISILLTSCLNKKETTSSNNNGTFKIEVNQKGYVPSMIKAPKGLETVKLLFTRTTDKTCAREVILEEQNIDFKLPLNQEVAITFNIKGNNEIFFGCHMDKMFSSRIITN